MRQFAHPLIVILCTAAEKMTFLWLLLFTLVRNSICEEDNIQHERYMRRWDLDGKTAQEHTTVGCSSAWSEGHCASLCRTTNGCTSFFYNTETRTCKLIDKQIYNSDTLVDEIHSRYYCSKYSVLHFKRVHG